MISREGIGRFGLSLFVPGLPANDLWRLISFKPRQSCATILELLATSAQASSS
jgi:hypothetical protein